MKNWESILVTPRATLRETLQAIDGAGSQLAVVVDAERRLLGTVSDGDARRAILAGASMADPVGNFMHHDPTCVDSGEDREGVLATMRRTGLHQLPVVTRDRRVVGLAVLNDYLLADHRDNWVVIMAGGLGSRLQELTRDTPKPMLKVGSRPLLETIVRSFADQGFRCFYLAVNYKAEQIESHFGSGRDFGVDIRYLREGQRLGTAGALSLLPEPPEHPLVVTNADLLTKQDFGTMLDKHIESGAHATMAVRQYEMQVPFGVVNVDDGEIRHIAEKPVQRFTVSAGMYVLSPEVLELVPRGQCFDMPALFDAALRKGHKVRPHHVDGYWLDIGRVTDFERANVDFSHLFD